MYDNEFPIGLVDLNGSFWLQNGNWTKREKPLYTRVEMDNGGEGISIGNIGRSFSWIQKNLGLHQQIDGPDLNRKWIVVDDDGGTTTGSNYEIFEGPGAYEEAVAYASISNDGFTFIEELNRKQAIHENGVVSNGYWVSCQWDRDSSSDFPTWDEAVAYATRIGRGHSGTEVWASIEGEGMLIYTL